MDDKTFAEYMETIRALGHGNYAFFHSVQDYAPVWAEEMADVMTQQADKLTGEDRLRSEQYALDYKDKGRRWEMAHTFAQLLWGHDDRHDPRRAELLDYAAATIGQLRRQMIMSYLVVEVEPIFSHNLIKNHDKDRLIFDVKARHTTIPDKHKDASGERAHEAPLDAREQMRQNALKQRKKKLKKQGGAMTSLMAPTARHFATHYLERHQWTALMDEIIAISDLAAQIRLHNASLSEHGRKTLDEYQRSYGAESKVDYHYIHRCAAAQYHRRIVGYLHSSRFFKDVHCVEAARILNPDVLALKPPKQEHDSHFARIDALHKDLDKPGANRNNIYDEISMIRKAFNTKHKVWLDAVNCVNHFRMEDYINTFMAKHFAVAIDYELGGPSRRP